MKNPLPHGRGTVPRASASGSLRSSEKRCSTKKEHFVAEQAALLAAGLESSRYGTVDDTGARHQGKNGDTTHMGNEQGAWCQSTPRKSWINFLPLWQAGHSDYRSDAEAPA